MFTGIIENLGEITKVWQEGSNVHFTVASAISHELKIDQSVAHDGVCLTVVSLAEGSHTVTAIDETLIRTNLGSWKPGRKVNLERCLAANGRFDGHIVQGHVDGIANCQSISDKNGSWLYRFGLTIENRDLVVEKGSICINGVSLTVVDAGLKHFSVAIIPFTYEYTNFDQIREGDKVNLEFDIIGKYVARIMQNR
jgi:riboflavin synthase